MFSAKMGYNFPNLESGKAVEVLEVQFDPNIGFYGSLATSDPEGIGTAILNEQESVNIETFMSQNFELY